MKDDERKNSGNRDNRADRGRQDGVQPFAREGADAEVISVDSRQVYRYLDVGTDKVSREVRREIIHHLIDIADPDEIYSAADFAQDADGAARRIIARGRVPLLIGARPFITALSQARSRRTCRRTTQCARSSPRR